MTRIFLALPLILSLGTAASAFGSISFPPDTWPGDSGSSVSTPVTQGDTRVGN